MTQPSTGTFRTIDFPGAQTGFTGRLNNGVVYKTIDGGGSWNSVFSTSANITTICFVNIDTGYVGAYFGSIYNMILRTFDGGQTWDTSYYANDAKDPEDILFIDQDTGFCVGNNSILKTSDGGNTWVNQNPGVNSILRSVYFIDPNLGFSVGSNGAIIKTIDGGTNWVGSAPGWPEYRAVWFINKDTGFVAGLGQTGPNTIPILYKSVNGGANWTSLNATISGPVYDVLFINDSTGFIVGVFGAIRKTTDGGNTWTTQSSGTTKTLYDIFFSDSLNGYISGIDILFRTTNGGVSWIEQQKEKEKICFFPNPCSYYIEGDFSFLKNEVGVLQIYDLLGQLIWSEKVESTSKKLSLSSLKNGTYYYSCSWAEGNLCGKITVLRD